MVCDGRTCRRSPRESAERRPISDEAAAVAASTSPLTRRMADVPVAPPVARSRRRWSTEQRAGPATPASDRRVDD